MNELKLMDIADDLVILNKNTLETLFHLDNADECVVLYMLYYRLAKWQKTNTIKATDEYVRKTLKWGKPKIVRAKNTLKENGLIEIIQKRDERKITGWFIKIKYVVCKENISKIFIKQEVSNQEVLKATSTKQNTIALSNNINCLKNKNKYICSKEKIEQETLFEIFWKAYPRKVSKGNAEKWFIKNKPSEELLKTMIDKIELLKKTEQWLSNNGQYIPYPATWLNAKGWEDEVKESPKNIKNKKATVETSTPIWFDEEIKETLDEGKSKMLEKMLEELK